jgi:tape measure domain-containing protein
MAQGAGIQLEVGLDLAFFRNQLVGLQAVTTGTKLSFGVTFKRLDIQNELNALAANIKKRNYFLEVKTNLASEIDNAKKLADSLARLQQVAQGTKGALPIGTGALGLKKGAGQPGANEIRALYEALAMAGAEGFETGTRKNRAQMVAQIGAVAKDTVAGLLNGLDSEDAKVQAAARSLGESLIASMKAVLGIASPSKEFEKIGKNVGEGFEKGALSSMDNAFDALENKMRQRGKILDTVARGIFRMLGMDPAAMLQQAREQRATSVRTPIAGLLPSFTSRGTREETIRQLTGGGPSVAQGPGMLALSNEALGRRVSAILQEYFKVAEVQVRESFDPRELKRSLNVFSYIAQSLRDAETRTKQARVAESVDSLMQTIDNAVRTAQARVRISRVQVAELGPRAQGALSAGRVAGLLPGRPSQASVLELNNILAGAIREYFAAVARGIKPNIGVQGRPLLGPGSAVAGLLPAAGGTTPRGQMRFNAVSTGAVLGQPQILRAPNIPSPIGGAGAGGGVPPRPPSGGGGGGMGGFGRALGGINLPGTGVVREIGNEFAMATKQVLLFGTAYKALAFITSFPAQVGQAVGALQSFNNTLKAISPTAEEARASNQFILDIVDRYNVPLQSARDGFTKLYASMAPAGFSGNEIRELFTGVSQAAATFGMSADKVDRVNYAFAQMASKGQVMSEELKGQLGDVLPGAMGIFAEAAGFKGPDAIQKFSKALEDGAYKGEAMRGLLKNVTVVLTKEFGPGAEGAARTFQGVINRMQNSTKLLYEAFEPVAVGFLNSVVMPLTSGIKTVTDGFNAFFSGTQAKTAGGSALARQLNELKPSFDGILSNLKQLIPTFQLLGDILLGVAKAFTVIAGNPITGFLVKVYANVLLVNGVFTLLGGKVLVALIGNISAAIARFVALNVAVATMQKTTVVANSTLAGTQLQMALLQKSASMATGPVIILRNALLSIANIGLIAIGINVVINGLSELDRLKKSLAEIGTFSSAKYRKEVSSMAKEDVNSSLIENRRTQKSIQQELGQYGGPVGAARGLVTGRDEELRARLLMVRVKEQELIRANKTAKAKVSLDSQVTGGLVPIEGVGAEGKGAGGSKAAKAAKERESQLPMLQLELDKTKELFAIDQQLIGARLADNASLVSSLELQKQLTELKYRGKQIALEQIPIDEQQAKMAALAVEYEKAIMESQLNLQLDMQKAREDLQKGVEETVKGYALENEYQQRYYELVQQGISPALAKIRVEVEKTFRKEKERINTLIEQYELQKASLEVQLAALVAQGNLSDVDSKRLDDIKERIRLLDVEIEKMGLLQSNLPSAQQSAIATAEGMTQVSPAQMGAERIGILKDEIADLTNIGNIAITVADGIGAAFAQAFQGLISGSMSAKEALGSFFKSVGDMFVQMAAEIIAKQMTMIILQTILKALGAVGGGGGGFAPLDNAGATNFSFNPGAMLEGPGFTPFANGGIAPRGFQAFANGGVVNGPTLGLVGEGKYNEAIVPLPDGRSIPVQMQGNGVRDKMNSNYNSAPSAPILSMSFESTSINGVEYVSRDQLEQAMAETRRAASRDGAQRGMTMTLDRIQNSSSTRRRIGV